MIEKTKAKPDERLALMRLFVLRDNLEKSMEPLSARLAVDRFAARGLKAAVTAISRAIEVVTSTFDDRSLEYVAKNAEKHEVLIRPRSIEPEPEWMYVKLRDLEALARAAHAGKCEVCMCDVAEVKKCAIRKALITVLDEPEAEFGCGFRDQLGI